jgi:hypothetical protein
MRAFRASLEQWTHYIVRATHATDVSVQMDGRDVVVFLRMGTLPYQHRFTSMLVYGAIGTRQIRPHQKVCRFADEVILGALQAYKDSTAR